MDVSKLRSAEIAAAIGGILLATSVFLPAYSPNLDNPNAQVAGARAGASIWEAHGLLRWLLLLAAVAPIVLVYIVARGHELSWPPGEMTAVIGLAAVTAVFYAGVIDRPGEPSGQIGLAFGRFVALLSSIAVAAGGAIRSSAHERKRKPPGVL
jgi:hypothetical protein